MNDATTNTALGDVIDDLMQTVEDGTNGFAAAAEKLEDSDRPDFAAEMRELGNERAGFLAELQWLAAQEGIEPRNDGTIAAAVHRGWMSVKDAVSGDDPKGVLDTAEQGEDHALNVYRKACDADLSGSARSIIERQLGSVQMAHDRVKQLRNAVS